MARQVEKVDPSIFTPIGRHMSSWIIPYLPSTVMPDHVTIFAFVLWVSAGIALYLASFADVWFLVAVLCTFGRWLADELDGELARTRSLASERGFFLDYFLDCVGATVVGFALANASYTIAPLVILYTLLYLNGVVLATCIMLLRGRFLLGNFGPSEVQASLLLLSLLSYAWPGPLVTAAGTGLGWFDLALLVMFPISFAEWLITWVRFAQELEPARATRDDRLP